MTRRLSEGWDRSEGSGGRSQSDLMLDTGYSMLEKMSFIQHPATSIQHRISNATEENRAGNEDNKLRSRSGFGC